MQILKFTSLRSGVYGDPNGTNYMSPRNIAFACKTFEFLVNKRKVFWGNAKLLRANAKSIELYFFLSSHTYLITMSLHLVPLTFGFF